MQSGLGVPHQTCPASPGHHFGGDAPGCGSGTSGLPAGRRLQLRSQEMKQIPEPTPQPQLQLCSWVRDAAASSHPMDAPGPPSHRSVALASRICEIPARAGPVWLRGGRRGPGGEGAGLRLWPQGRGRETTPVSSGRPAPSRLGQKTPGPLAAEGPQSPGSRGRGRPGKRGGQALRRQDSDFIAGFEIVLAEPGTLGEAFCAPPVVVCALNRLPVLPLFPAREGTDIPRSRRSSAYCPPPLQRMPEGTPPRCAAPWRLRRPLQAGAAAARLPGAQAQPLMKKR
uniref:uncharacterized protein LOC128929278 n=1 Tax=Callithrix jacchus TaxID=9483 RepID=UPI0023DD3C24|nr:uncharacterized protein LOC128929278 [Callithrix jacchus]